MTILRLSKLISGMFLPKIRHAHDLDDQTRPPGEMLRPLTSAGIWVVLFPGKPGLFPTLVNSVNQVLSQLGVNLTSLLLVRS